LHKWHIVGREHYWKDKLLNSEGFIDIVLSRNTMRMVVECKRVLDKDWIFLVTDKRDWRVSKVKFLISHIQKIGTTLEWDDIDYLPESYESPFCILGKEKDRPTLERYSSDTLIAMKSLAVEESNIISSQTRVSDTNITYVPVIVTTADLHICLFHPSDVSIENGKVSPDSKFEKVDYIRFRKGLATDLEYQTIPTVQNLRDANKENERTVFVIQANKLVGFLRSFENS
jgi:hypothetical protein